MIVGIDIGTQSLKAVVTDERLRVLGEASTPYEATFPRPGWAEQSPEVWERALAPTIAGALGAAGASPVDVEGLGICGQLDGCVATDAAGKALSACIIWMDRRAVAEIADVSGEQVRAATGVVLDATHMAAKIRWLKHHCPPARAAARFHQPVSYLVARLTGAHLFDHGLASTTMLYRLDSRAFDPELLAQFGVDAGELPAIADAGARAGGLNPAGAALTGLEPDTPVAVGTGDDFSNPLGAGVIAPGSLVCTVGTAEVVGALHPEPIIDPRGLVETHGYAGQHYFIENPGWLSGGALRWFVDTYRLEGFAELDSLAAGVEAGAEGVCFLPALSGAMAPEWVASARGCYYGLSASHGSAHLARATLEGCGFAMRDVLEGLHGLGVRCDRILLLGGGARSRLWGQIRADLSGLPVDVPSATDTSPIGAAVLASVAAGVHPSLEQAVAELGGEVRTLEPDPRHRAAYDAAYARYGTLFECLRPLYLDGEGGQ